MVCLLTATALTQNVDTSSSGAQCSTLPCVTTYHYDNARDGVTAQETLLTPSSFTLPHNFGVISTAPAQLDGLVYAQPLYLSQIPMAIQGNSTCSGKYNVVFVATENNSVYAFAVKPVANSTSVTLTQCWKLNLNQAGEHAIAFENLPIDPGSSPATPCSNTVPQSGITGTPVIDATVNPAIMYVVTAHQSGTAPSISYFYRLHAIYLNQGTEATSVPFDVGNQITSVGGPPLNYESQRPGLAMTRTTSGPSSANLYVTFGSFCDANSRANGDVFNGYVVGANFVYSTLTFSSIGVFATEPEFNTSAVDDGGIWMSGAAPAVDTAGSLYFSVGNGNWNGTASKRATDLGSSVVKLVKTASPLGLIAADFYTPNDFLDLNSGTGSILPKDLTVCSAYSSPPATCPGPPVGESLTLGKNDYDLGAGGVLLVSPTLPIGVMTPCGTNGELLAAGKEGVAYGICYSLSTTTSPLQTTMGGLDGAGYMSSNHSNAVNTACTVSPNVAGGIAQCFQAVDVSAALDSIPPGEPGVRGISAFWAGPVSNPQNYLYVSGSQYAMQAYQIIPSGAGAGTFNISQPPSAGSTFVYPGSIPVISWNGSDPGTGILWAVEDSSFGRWDGTQSHPAAPSILHAYAAVPFNQNGTIILNPLWSSPSSGAGVAPGAVKFTIPTVANGMVFVAGGLGSYAPGPSGGTKVTCTSEATNSSTTCQGQLVVFGQIN